jgi:integrating conjugative element relaxase (TIGR03760 family)
LATNIVISQELLIWLIAGTGTTAIVSLWFVFRPKRNADTIDRGGLIAESSSASITNDALPVLHADELIARLGLKTEINVIADLIGISRANFTKDVLPAIRAVVEFTQQLPASQSHHHANPGGLAQHVLDVARRALAIRGGRELPVGCSPEERSRRKHRWSVGVFLGALLHDIGKPITDVIVQFKTQSSSDPIRWQPLTGSMLEMGLTHYTVTFPVSGEREYRAHEKLGIVLLQRCVPGHVLSWLGEDAGLMQSLFALLSGDPEKSGVLAEIVRQADMESTAHNLRHGSRVRFSAAKQTPLIEVLMQRLRHLLSHVDGVSIPLNASGAGGFVGTDYTWLVVPRVVDMLVDDIKRVEPERSLPTERTRIFDTFQEFGAIDARPGTTQCVWKIRVRGGDAAVGTDFVHELSALKFRTSLLFKTTPKLFNGQIEVIGETTTQTVAIAAPNVMASAAIVASPFPPLAPCQRQTEATVAAAQATEPPMGLVAKSLIESVTAQEGMATTAASPVLSKEKKRLPSPGAREVMLVAAAPPVQQPGVTPPNDKPVVAAKTDTSGASASAMLDSLMGNFSGSATSIEPTPIAPLQDKQQHDMSLPSSRGSLATSSETTEIDQDALAAERPTAPLPPVVVPHSAKLADTKTMGALAGSFMRWLQEGLAQQTIECNGSNAFFHTLEEGVGLVSPRAFQVFAASLTKELQPGQKLPKELSQTVIAHVSKIQSELKKAKVVRQNSDKERPDYFHAYVISSSQKRINMMLIDEPALYFSTLPPPNRLLSRAQLQAIS